MNAQSDIKACFSWPAFLTILVLVIGSGIGLYMGWLTKRDVGAGASILIGFLVFIWLINVGCHADTRLNKGEFRRAIAGILVSGFLILTIIATIYPIQDNEILLLFIEMVSIVIGFYFGSKTASSGEEEEEADMPKSSAEMAIVAIADAESATIEAENADIDDTKLNSMDKTACENAASKARDAHKNVSIAAVKAEIAAVRANAAAKLIEDENEKKIFTDLADKAKAAADKAKAAADKAKAAADKAKAAADKK